MVQPDPTPLRHRLLLALAVPGPPGDDHGLGGCAAIDQRPGIARMAEPLLDTVLAGPAPPDVLAPGPRAHLWPRELGLPIPEHRLPGPAQFPQFLQDAS